MIVAVGINQLQTATSLIGALDFSLDHVVNHRYLYVTEFAKTISVGTRTEIQIKA